MPDTPPNTPPNGASPNGALPPDDRMLAAELALGVLEGPARDSAERRAERDAAFARAVDDWHAQLEPLLDEVEAIAPPTRAWRGIEAAIGRADVAPARSRSLARTPVERQAIPAWRAFALMVMGGALATFATVTLIERDLVRLGTTEEARERAPALVATLTPEGSAPAALARLDASGALTVRIALAGTDERVPELWLIPGDGVPRSLGLVAAGADGGAATIALPEGIAPRAGQALAVSLEPPGGSPTGAPTGPVVASGELLSL